MPNNRGAAGAKLSANAANKAGATGNGSLHPHKQVQGTTVYATLFLERRDLLLLHAQPVDAELDRIAGLQIFRLDLAA